MTKAIKDSFKLALAQLNPVAGDLEGNVKKARAARARAARDGADLVAFTELYLTGYPIEDLVLKPALQSAAREACEALAHDTGDGGPALLVFGHGGLRRSDRHPPGHLHPDSPNLEMPGRGARFGGRLRAQT